MMRAAERPAVQVPPKRAAQDSIKIAQILRAEGGRAACACWTALHAASLSRRGAALRVRTVSLLAFTFLS
jgi:hypothetical protein